MKKLAMVTIVCSFSALTLTGCGGGNSAPPAVKKAVTTMSLFGAMSSNSKIATVQATMTVPDSVMVNYSSPPGATSGIFPLRSGFVVPSGPVKVSAADISGAYDTDSRKLTINLLNNPSTPVNLRSNSTGSGEEIATINFTLASQEVTTSLPTEDPAVTVGQDRSTPQNINIGYLNGCKVIFSTTIR